MVDGTSDPSTSRPLPLGFALSLRFGRLSRSSKGQRQIDGPESVDQWVALSATSSVKTD